MRYVLRTILVLVVAGGIGILGMAIFSDLPPPEREVSRPVQAM